MNGTWTRVLLEVLPSTWYLTSLMQVFAVAPPAVQDTLPLVQPVEGIT